ncbi:MAG: SDR family NAD(P)-dependent oxidoreductase [Gammaproteobacteria bacterium]|nr:SDR family NAD(P)-dependent oxidoreductase [Gammaproteobacteria bacterium]MDE0271162.1 SDR family NAD(P)-dependent oxidoreductase [Gammaproteobacteria bacterium]
MELEGKRIIVTGSARGMGAGTVRAYVKAGANVVGMDVLDEQGAAVSAEASAQGPGTAGYLHVDVADQGSVERAFAEAVAELGGLDGLAHPAAIHRTSDAGEVSVEDWDLMFAVNVRGTMLTNQVAHRHMKASGGGSIINFGSISGQRPEPTAAAYSTAKGAVHSWTRTAAGTWGKDNIRVNAILPAMATPMYYEALGKASDEQREANNRLNLSTIFMGGKYGDPDKDLGPVMVFLASDASWFITGQLIAVDGGQTSVR